MEENEPKSDQLFYDADLESSNSDFRALREYLARANDYECPKKNCSAFFETASQLNLHIGKRHKNLKKMCFSCYKLIDKLGSRDHDSKCYKRRFRCGFSDCGSDFATPIDTRVHQVELHKLSIKCPYKNCETVVNRIELSGHIRNAHVIKTPVKCEICQKELLKRHYEEHRARCDGNFPSQLAF